MRRRNWCLTLRAPRHVLAADCIHGARSRLYGHRPVHCQPQVRGSGCCYCTRFLPLTFARGLRLCRYVPAIIVSTTMLLEPAVGTAIGVLLQETPIPGNMPCRTGTTTALAYKANGGSSLYSCYVRRRLVHIRWYAGRHAWACFRQRRLCQAPAEGKGDPQEKEGSTGTRWYQVPTSVVAGHP